MKNIFKTASLTVMLTLVAPGCGKQSVDQKSPEQNTFEGKPDTEVMDYNLRDLQDAIIAVDQKKVKMLLQSQDAVHLNKIIEDGETLMTTAVLRGVVETVELLLEFNVSVQTPNSNRQTPLMLASKMGNMLLVKRLLIAGAKTDEKDEDGNTALHLAIQNKKEDIAIYLIDKSANYDITNKDNLSPLAYTKMHETVKVADRIRSKQGSRHGMPMLINLQNEIYTGTVDSLRQYLSLNPRATDRFKEIDFVVQVIRERPEVNALEIIKVLYHSGANIQGHPDKTDTPLVEAINRRYEKVVEYLLTKEVNLNTADELGTSPLSLSIKVNSFPLVKMLYKEGAYKKYSHYSTGKKKVVNVCVEAVQLREKLKTVEEKEINKAILETLNCRIRLTI